MQGQSYHVKTILEQCDAREKTFLAIKDSPGDPLGHSAYRWEEKFFGTSPRRPGRTERNFQRIQVSNFNKEFFSPFTWVSAAGILGRHQDLVTLLVAKTWRSKIRGDRSNRWQRGEHYLHATATRPCQLRPRCRCRSPSCRTSTSSVSGGSPRARRSPARSSTPRGRWCRSSCTAARRCSQEDKLWLVSFIGGCAKSTKNVARLRKPKSSLSKIGVPCQLIIILGKWPFTTYLDTT